ncbi:hypothetical protein B0H16DRAFT_1811646 [Mycena metata]|uniref:Uncharacterized protein n=1 Tax=Mycena metata TaxID=1033252 RepID=A0AAD7MDW7_9AGAR|nr:hypothetical protein B0H16DRAFT_1811646 [Mycena metata]
MPPTPPYTTAFSRYAPARAVCREIWNSIEGDIIWCVRVLRVRSLAPSFSLLSPLPPRPRSSSARRRRYPRWRRTAVSRARDDIEFRKDLNIVSALFISARCCGSRARSTACQSTPRRLLVSMHAGRAFAGERASYPIHLHHFPAPPSLMYPITPFAPFPPVIPPLCKQLSDVPIPALRTPTLNASAIPRTNGEAHRAATTAGFQTAHPVTLIPSSHLKCKFGLMRASALYWPVRAGCEGSGDPSHLSFIHVANFTSSISANPFTAVWSSAAATSRTACGGRPLSPPRMLLPGARTALAGGGIHESVVAGCAHAAEAGGGARGRTYLFASTVV